MMTSHVPTATVDDAARPRRRLGRAALAAAAALALVLAMAACGGDDDSSSDTTAATGGGNNEAAANADATLEITDTSYSDVSVPAGGTLAVVNSSGTQHTFTADDGSFDETVGDGETVTVTVPSEAGDYPFHCEIHPSMTATLTVE